MESLENKEIKFTQGMEKVIMYFMYLVFGGVFAVIAWTGTLREAWIMIPIAAVSIPLTKWGIKWQNERYVRSAKNVDEIEILKQEVKSLDKRLDELENK